MSINWHVDPYDGIQGDKIVLKARRLSKPELVQGSGSHKASEINGTDNARAWIERPKRFVASTSTPPRDPAR